MAIRQGRIVAALDGIEVLSSYSRHCDSCLERRVAIPKAGVNGEQLQYYHRAVGCQIINGPVKTFLALEWLQPGEGEDTAALRLLRNLPDRYGSRFSTFFCWMLFMRRRRCFNWPRNSAGTWSSA